MVDTEFTKISVVGLGYVGLPTAVTLASRGIPLLGVDINPAAVEAVNSGRAHIVEAHLDTMLPEVVQRGTLRASTKPEPCDAYLIAVPTPVMPDHRPDLRAVFSAALSLAPVLRRGDLVILESTSPPGTTEEMSRRLAAARPDLSFPQDKPEGSDVMVAFCPERILPGRTFDELVENDRIIGGMDRRSAARAMQVYQLFCRGDMALTTARTAELAKCAENAFRDANIAFSNELSMICDRLGLDALEVIRLANRHPRVNMLDPGCGVGGHCIPVDPWFIIDAAPDISHLMRTAREVNVAKSHYIADRIKAAAKKSGRRVALLGLAYKPDVDDLRESPALEICEAVLADPDITGLIVEPHIEALPGSLAEKANARLVTADEALAESDVLAVLVGHTIFKALPVEATRDHDVIDAVGLFDPRLM